MARLASRRAGLAVPPARTVDPARSRVWLAGLGPVAGRQLGMPELAPLLDAYGIPRLAARVAASAADAAAVAEEIGFPVALKIVSPDITHKTEVGGVALGLRDARAVREAAEAILRRVAIERPEATIRGLLVEAMASAGKELLLGGVRDDQFGPLVMVGFGGIYVEVFADTTARLAPVSSAEALVMLDELKMAPLLRGTRGEPPVDRDDAGRDRRPFLAAPGGSPRAGGDRDQPLDGRALRRGGGGRAGPAQPIGGTDGHPEEHGQEQEVEDADGGGGRQAGRGPAQGGDGRAARVARRA